MVYLMIEERTMLVVTLPDGSEKQFPKAVTVAEVAASIGAGLAKAALAGKVDGKLVDTSFKIDHDASLEIVTDKHPDARRAAPLHRAPVGAGRAAPVPRRAG